MWNGLLASWRGLRHMNHRGYIYIWANVAAVVLSLPVITAPAAWAGLVRMSHLAYRDRSADLNDFWDAFKENLWRGIVMGLLNIVIITVNVSNLWVYREQSGLEYDLMRLVWLLALVLWFSVQFYLWPLYFEMEQPTLHGALRNAALMTLMNPLFTFVLWLVVVLIVIISTVMVVAWLLLTLSMLASISNSAVNNRLQSAGHAVDLLRN